MKSELVNSEIPWNFAKFLVNKDGKILKYYNPSIKLEIIQSDIKKYIDYYKQE